MNFPSNVKYTKDHEWIRQEGDIAYVGITDYAQDQLGDIVFVDVQTEGETLRRADRRRNAVCRRHVRHHRSRENHFRSLHSRIRRSARTK